MHDDYTPITPERFAEIRRDELHMSQADLAKATGLSAPTVSRYETGKSPVPKFIDLALRWLTRP